MLKSRCALVQTVLASLLLSLPLLGQAPPTSDAYVRYAYPSTNFGNAPLLRVRYNPAVTSYVQFSLASLPPDTSGSGVSKATLRLYVAAQNFDDDNTPFTAGSFDIYRVTSAW